MNEEQGQEFRDQINNNQLSPVWIIITWGTTGLIVLAVLYLAITAALRPDHTPMASERRLANVEVLTVQTRDHRETLVLPARLLADRSASITSEIPLRLREWRVAEGGMVEQGEIVVIMEDQDLKAALAELQAALPAATSAEQTARRDWQRFQALIASEAITESELERAQHSLIQAESSLAQLHARIVKTELQLQKTILHAPISGRLDRHLAEPGELLGVEAPIGRLYDLRHVRVKVDIPDRYIPFFDHRNPAVATYLQTTLPKAEPHLEAMVELPGMPKLTGGTYEGLKLPAEVYRIAQSADPRSNTFEVILRLRNPAEALREGMIVRAHIEYLRYHDAVLIPLHAVQVSELGPRILVVERLNGEDIAVVRDIKPISIREDEILIESGVEPGERLLIAGGRGVVDGERVQVVIENGNSQYNIETVNQ